MFDYHLHVTFPEVRFREATTPSPTLIRPDLRAAARLFSAPPVTRFAPSPTGYLHLGHVVNAVYVWGLSGALDGTVLLRIEDHDRIRSRPEYESALYDDLAWLGFVDARDAAGRPEAATRQSDRDAVYEQALTQLRRSHHVYACDCSRREIGGPRYTGRCRARNLPERPGVGLRVQIDAGVDVFDDLLLGRIEQSPAEQCGDLLVKDRDGHWTYQFAVTVDDLEQGVTLVIRGMDLVSSTGRQIRLSRMLATAGVRPAPPPIAYLHHPLIYGDDGQKLSKSAGAAGVRSMRQQGLSPAEVIGQAAAAAGLQVPPRPIDASAAPFLFRSETH